MGTHTGEHEKVEGDGPKPESHPLHPLVRKVLGDVRIIIGLLSASVVAVFLSGWSAFAQVQRTAREEAKRAAQEETAGIRTEQAALRYVVEEVRKGQASTNQEVRAVNEAVRDVQRDMRRVFPSLPPLKKEE